MLVLVCGWKSFSIGNAQDVVVTLYHVLLISAGLPFEVMSSFISSLLVYLQNLDSSINGGV